MVAAVGARIRAPKPVHWRFLNDAERRQSSGERQRTTTLSLAKWADTSAFILERLMLAWISAETVVRPRRRGAWDPIFLANACLGAGLPETATPHCHLWAASWIRAWRQCRNFGVCCRRVGA